MTNLPENAILLVDGLHGIYVPKVFADTYGAAMPYTELPTEKTMKWNHAICLPAVEIISDNIEAEDVTIGDVLKAYRSMIDEMERTYREDARAYTIFDIVDTDEVDED